MSGWGLPAVTTAITEAVDLPAHRARAAGGLLHATGREHGVSGAQWLAAGEFRLRF
jgi:hypothetical protein